MIKYEFILFLGLGLAFGIAELISVRRAIKRDRAGLTKGAAESIGRAGRDERGP